MFPAVQPVTHQFGTLLALMNTNGPERAALTLSRIKKRVSFAAAKKGSDIKDRDGFVGGRFSGYWPTTSALVETVRGGIAQ